MPELPNIAFGVSLPAGPSPDRLRSLVREAEHAGLDLIGIADHPYAPQTDALAMIGHLLATTSRVHLFPDVANLPLRHPALLARSAATMNVLSGGRFELGLGAGGYWQAIEAMGGPRRSTREALDALVEAVQVMRELWQPGRIARIEGRHYTVTGIEGQHAGPGPIEVWIGAQGPRSLRVTGRIGDGWAAPLASYLPYERWAASNAIIDEAALRAGRSPRAVRRIAQLAGTILPPDPSRPSVSLVGDAPLRGDAADWIQALTRLSREQPFTTFVFWPERPDSDQVLRFADQVAPVVRANLRTAPPAPPRDGAAATALAGGR